MHQLTLRNARFVPLRFSARRLARGGGTSTSQGHARTVSRGIECNNASRRRKGLPCRHGSPSDSPEPGADEEAEGTLLAHG
jgi:hypothetical protein